MSFESLPLELQQRLLKKVPLSSAMLINKNLIDVNQQRYCHDYHLSQKQMKQIKNNHQQPFVLFEIQRARTGHLLNASLMHLEKMIGVSLIEGESEDYVVVSAMNQSDVQTSDYSILFDAYPIQLDLDLITLYDYYLLSPCQQLDHHFAKKQISIMLIIEFKMNSILFILILKTLDDYKNHYQYYLNRIQKELKTIKRHHINVTYAYWFHIIVYYMRLFSAALLLNLVTYQDFMIPFGDQNEYILINDPNYFGPNTYQNYLNNVNLLNDLIVIINKLYQDLLNYFMI